MGNSNQKLSTKQINELQQSTKFTREELQEWHQVFMREHPTGRMDQQTFIRENQFVHGGDEELWKHLFGCMDTDGNGTIEFKEFIIAVSIGTKGTAEQKLKWAFNIYDIDHNGTIEFDEMLHLLKSVFKMLPCDDNETPHERCRKIFDKMDVNGDQKLTLEEFITGCKQDQQIIKAMSLF